MNPLRILAPVTIALAMMFETTSPAWAAPSTPTADTPSAESTYLPSGTHDFSPTSGVAASWVCTVFASDADRQTTGQKLITGSGWQSCTGPGWSPQRAEVLIQRSRWYGWETMATTSGAWTAANWSDHWVSYNCTGTGTHDFRIVTKGWAAGGTSTGEVQSGEHHTYIC